MEGRARPEEGYHNHYQRDGCKCVIRGTVFRIVPHNVTTFETDSALE